MNSDCQSNRLLQGIAVILGLGRIWELQALGDGTQSSEIGVNTVPGFFILKDSNLIINLRN